MADDKAVEEGEKKETSPTATASGNVKKKRKGFISRIWNGIFRLHGDDFEKRLKHISKEEATVIARVTRRSRSRRQTSRNLIVFSVIFEVIAVGYAIMTTRSVGIDWKMRAIRVLPMFLLPALSSAVYSAFITFTRMCDRRDQNILEKLRAERQAKIDELKEKTNYYTTQQLIQRYDPDPAAKAAAATVLASKLGADSGMRLYMGDESNLSGASTGKSNDVELVQSSGLRNRKQVQTRSTSPGTSTPNFADQQLAGSGGFDQTQTSEYNQHAVVEHHQPQSSTPQDGGWIARIAALLVGEDPTQSYALICGNCHMHNGLVRKEDFPFITYYCPHCHALNKPKQLDGSVSGLASPNAGSVQMDEGILGLPSLNVGSVQMDERISGLPSLNVGSVQMDERISVQLANESSPLSLTPNFILPEHKRPHLSEVKYLDSIPIIDLSYCDGNNPSSLEVIHKISKACEEFGFFQIVNHGVPDQVCTKMMKAITNFFELAPEEREHLSSTDNTKNVRLFNYYLQVDGGEKVKLWSECFAHPWYPIDDIIQLLPEKIGTQYREAFTEYAKEVGSLVRRLLSLISIGLGLEEDCLLKKLGEQPRQRAQANFYPPCPDPELTMGLLEHTDLNAITVLLQSEVSGLQVNKDGKWISVPCIPNAFVINLADQIEVLSNGRYKSVLHRAVTNNVQPRISMAMFYGPNPETIIGPIHELIDEEHPPKYRNYHFSKFLEEFFNQEGTRRMVKEVFELPCNVV